MQDFHAALRNFDGDMCKLETNNVESTFISGTGCALACTECTCTLGSAHGKGAHSP